MYILTTNFIIILRIDQSSQGVQSQYCLGNVDFAQSLGKVRPLIISFARRAGNSDFKHLADIAHDI